MDLFDQVVAILKEFIANGAGNAYVRDGMSTLYLDYRETGSLDSIEYFEKLASAYVEAGGDVETAAAYVITNEDWWYDTEDYYEREVETACRNRLMDEPNGDELVEAFDEALEEDRWNVYDAIGYEGLDSSGCIEFFPSTVRVTVSLGHSSDREDEILNYFSGGREHDPADADNMLTKFLDSQGIDPERIQTLQDAEYAQYESGEQPYLTPEVTDANEQEKTVLEELDNLPASYCVLAGAGAVSLEDWCKLATGSFSSVTFTPRCSDLFGLWNPWDGAGSLLGIKINSDFTVGVGDVQSIGLEYGRKNDIGWTIIETYGLGTDAFDEDAIKVN